MKLGMVLRVMGPEARADLLLECARAAEAAGLEELWVVDHIAIPPDDAEGSGGRYLDPLATLAFLAAATQQIGLGTSVLILPYRPALPTAKQVATIQELSGGRLRLGVGVGWMQPEFRALGVDRSRRGALADEVLDLLRRSFESEDDVVIENGQPFLFRPHPARPPVFVGGASPAAFRRAIEWDGWLPMSGEPDQLGPKILQLRELAEAEGRPMPEVVSLGGLPREPRAGADRLAALAEVGVTRFAVGGRYADAGEFRRHLDALCAARELS